MPSSLTAPFSYFGGKREIALTVWQWFGDPAVYVEPFCGSLAVLLNRPKGDKSVEIINDADCYVANFWRAVQHDPEAVFEAAYRPRFEVDQHAVHAELRNWRSCSEAYLSSHIDRYDARIAGLWAWLQSVWIGGGAARKRGEQMISCGPIAGSGCAPTHRQDLNRDQLYRWIKTLSARVEGLQVLCGDWSRCVTPTPTGQTRTNRKTCAVFLDPPYDSDSQTNLYGEREGVAQDAAEWARKHASPTLKIALCGYEGEHDMPGWHEVAWKARGGFGNQGSENKNAARERVWFSPACKPPQPGLFDMAL